MAGLILLNFVKLNCQDLKDLLIRYENSIFSVESSKDDILSCLKDKSFKIEDAYHANSGYKLYKSDEIGSWKNVSSRYSGIRNVLSANSEVVSQFKEDSGKP